VVSEGTPSWGPGLVSCAGLEASGMSPGLLLSQGSISVPQTRGNHAKARSSARGPCAIPHDFATELWGIEPKYCTELHARWRKDSPGFHLA